MEYEALIDGDPAPFENGSSTLVAGIGVERCTRQPWLVQVE